MRIIRTYNEPSFRVRWHRICKFSNNYLLRTKRCRHCWRDRLWSRPNQSQLLQFVRRLLFMLKYILRLGLQRNLDESQMRAHRLELHHLLPHQCHPLSMRPTHQKSEASWTLMDERRLYESENGDGRLRKMPLTRTTLKTSTNSNYDRYIDDTRLKLKRTA